MTIAVWHFNDTWTPQWLQLSAKYPSSINKFDWIQTLCSTTCLGLKCFISISKKCKRSWPLSGPLRPLPWHSHLLRKQHLSTCAYCITSADPAIVKVLLQRGRINMHSFTEKWPPICSQEAWIPFTYYTIIAYYNTCFRIVLSVLNIPIRKQQSEFGSRHAPLQHKPNHQKHRLPASGLSNWTKALGGLKRIITQLETRTPHGSTWEHLALQWSVHLEIEPSKIHATKINWSKATSTSGKAFLFQQMQIAISYRCLTLAG